MSRSRKKFPGFNDSEGSKVKSYFLRLMNRRIRRLDAADEDGWIPDGNHYRKFICRWDYRDYSFRFFSDQELNGSWLGKEKAYQARMK